MQGKMLEIIGTQDYSMLVPLKERYSKRCGCKKRNAVNTIVISCKSVLQISERKIFPLFAIKLTLEQIGTLERWKVFDQRHGTGKQRVLKLQIGHVIL